MLSRETECRIKSLLVQISEGESRAERARQDLALISDFSPFMAFQRLDRNASDRISSFEILNFLREKNPCCSYTESECYRLVKFFDSDGDSRLSCEDFKQMVLPCEDENLRQIVN